MRAITQDRLGPADVLHLTETARPVPGPTEVLVRVRAAGVNPVDRATRESGGLGTLGAPPFTVGWDVSGVVEETGIGVTRFAPGDDVYGMPWFPRQAAAYAEYVTAPSRHFAPKPVSLSHVEAAGLPLAGLTAWQTLVDTAGLRPGQRVLVTAAAGGVGHLAVQIAAARGAYVLGTARAANHAFLRSLGVSEPIDYTAVDVADAVRDVDVVLDLAGDDPARLVRTLRLGGVLVPVPEGLDDVTTRAAAEAGVRAVDFLVEPDHAGLAELSALVDAGRLAVTVAATYPLGEAARAHEHGATGRTRGKIVLTVD
ncbi:MAG TPA: NADP-dependent oxidoreductase [Actinocatenispora sp.]